jgi:hypothetical protein
MRGKLLNMMVFFSVFLWISGIECSAEEMEVHPLDFRVLEAEYSKTLGTLIMVSTTPTNAVHIYDPRSETDISVTLPLTPTCVSVSPDGLYAAIGHDAWISYVNLTTASVEKTISVSCDVLDIVLAGNGYMYAFSTTRSMGKNTLYKYRYRSRNFKFGLFYPRWYFGQTASQWKCHLWC